MMFAQSKIASDIYHDYEDAEDVLAMSLNYDLIDILDLDLDLNDQMRHISGDVYQVKFIVFGDESKSKSSLAAIDRKLSASAMEEIPIPENVEDDKDYQMLKFYGVKKGSSYSDICMLVLSDDGKSGVFVAVNGNIKVGSES